MNRPAHLDMTRRRALADEHWNPAEHCTMDDLALLERGWPEIRVLVPADSHKLELSVYQDRIDNDAARATISDIDPAWGVYWTAEAAQRYLNDVAQPGFSLCFDEDDAGRAALARRASDDREVTTDTLDAILGKPQGPGNGLQYGFLWHNAIWLAEALLGSDVVAERIATAIESRDDKQWTSNYIVRGDYFVLDALQMILLRASDEAVESTLRRLTRLRTTRPEGPLTAFLDALREPPGPDEPLARGDRSRHGLSRDVALARLNNSRGHWSLTPQFVFLFGPEILPAGLFGARTRGEPSWKQRAWVEQLGVFTHPRIVDIMVAHLGSVGARGAPRRWLLDRHADLREHLQRLYDAEHPRRQELGELLNAIAEGEKSIAEARRERPALPDFMATMLEILQRLVAEIRVHRGDHDEERRAFHEAVLALIELRAGHGWVMPDERIGHLLGADGVWDSEKNTYAMPPVFQLLDPNDEEFERWFTYVDEATF